MYKEGDKVLTPLGLGIVVSVDGEWCNVRVGCSTSGRYFVGYHKLALQLLDDRDFATGSVVEL